MRSPFLRAVGVLAAVTVVGGAAASGVFAPSAKACSTADATGCAALAPRVVTLTVGPNFVPDSKGGTVKFSGASSTPGDVTSGTNTITNTTTTGVHPQDFVSGAGIPANTHVVSVDSSTQITMSANATATAAATAISYNGLLLGGAVVNCHTASTSYTPADPNAVITGTAVAGKPTKIIINFQPGYLLNISNAVNFSSGCSHAGDANAIDFAIYMPNSDGRTTGVQWDAVKVAGGSGVHVTGQFNCGLPGNGAHQDGVQILGGTGYGFYDYTVGDWKGEHATCRGDGGGNYINCSPTVPPAAPGCLGTPESGFTFERGRVIVCNKGLNAGFGNDSRVTGIVEKGVFRTGAPSDYQAGGTCDPAITNTVPPGTPITASAADNGSGFMFGGSTGVTNVATVGNVGETWCATGCAWSPGFNPAYDNGA